MLDSPSWQDTRSAPILSWLQKLSRSLASIPYHCWLFPWVSNLEGVSLSLGVAVQVADAAICPASGLVSHCFSDDDPKSRQTFHLGSDCLAL